MRALVGSLALLLLPALAGSSEQAREVRFPLTVDYELLARLAAHELRGSGEEATALWRSDDGCSVFEIARIRVGPADGQLEIRAEAQGRAGLGVLSWCLFPVKRDADLRIRARPVLGPDWQLRLTGVETTILDRQGRSTFVMRRFSDALGEPLEDAVARIRVDLTPPVEDVRGLLRSSWRPDHAERAIAAVESMRPIGITAAPTGVRAELAMTVPAAPPETVGPEPPLTAEEHRRWQEALGNWDAFLTFAVKELGLTDGDPAVVDALFRLFVDGRHALLDALAAGPEHDRDPVRELFLETWDELRRVVRHVARRHGGERSDALLYVRFLLAGDALAAVERIGPDVGIDISADGLRRLARMLDPDTLFDPQERSEAPDPQLRALFGFHEPPATPLPPEPPAAPLPPEPPPAGAPGPTSWWHALIGVAHAAGAVPNGDLLAIGRRLDRWVPGAQELSEYRGVVTRLFDLVASAEQERGTVPADARALFRRTVRATAWQESCWHHYRSRNGRPVVLASRTGDVGIMQVNRRVWRGVFDPTLLERDVVYNADAGAQILAQYMARYGLREARVRGGDPARATYAAYNGGPRAYTRYRTGRRASAYTRLVDGAFWKKYQIVAAGKELEHVPCPPTVS